MTDTSPAAPLHEHAYRTPDSLTDEECLRTRVIAPALYPGTRLSHTGDPEDERHIREAIAEADILDNPSLRPHTPNDGADGSAEDEASDDAFEVGPGFDALTAEQLALDLAELVTASRRRLGLSQRALAERTGMRQPHIARLEAGLHTPSVETLIRVAGALGVTLQVEVGLDGARLGRVEPAHGTVLYDVPRVRGGEVINVVAHVPPARPGQSFYRALFSLTIGDSVGLGEGKGKTTPPPIDEITIAGQRRRPDRDKFAPGDGFNAPFVFRFSSSPDAPTLTEIPVSITLPGGPDDLYKRVKLVVGFGAMPIYTRGR